MKAKKKKKFSVRIWERIVGNIFLQNNTSFDLSSLVYGLSSICCFCRILKFQDFNWAFEYIQSNYVPEKHSSFAFRYLTKKRSPWYFDTFFKTKILKVFLKHQCSYKKIYIKSLAWITSPNCHVKFLKTTLFCPRWVGGSRDYIPNCSGTKTLPNEVSIWQFDPRLIKRQPPILCVAASFLAVLKIKKYSLIRQKIVNFIHRDDWFGFIKIKYL